MRRFALAALLGLAMAATGGAAQQRSEPGPGPGGPPMGPLANPAGFILGHTGELRLTDAQVVRLAGLARRAEERRQAMRTAMLERRREAAPAQGARPADARPGGEAMQQAQEQARAELRDAIAVLTPEQQAAAWEMVARPRGPGGAGGAGGVGMRRGPGGPPMRPGGPPMAPDGAGAPPPPRPES
jgi:hypothetical protein